MTKNKANAGQSGFAFFFFDARHDQIGPAFALFLHDIILNYTQLVHLRLHSGVPDNIHTHLYLDSSSNIAHNRLMILYLTYDIILN